MDDQITAKEAVKRALEAIQDLYEGTTLGDLLLEEIEQEGSMWLVTISFTRPGRGGGISAIVAPPREYKRVKIDVDSGAFEGMEIRVLPTPEQSGRTF